MFFADRGGLMLGGYKEVFAICSAISLENIFYVVDRNCKIYYSIINTNFNEVCD